MINDFEKKIHNSVSNSSSANANEIYVRKKVYDESRTVSVARSSTKLPELPK